VGSPPPHPDTTDLASRSPSGHVRIYIGISFLTLALLILTVWILSRQPLLYENPLTSLGDDWTILSGADGDLKLQVPASWAAHESIDLDSKQALAALMSSNPLLTEGLQPLGGLAPDLEPLLVVEAPGSGHSAFIVVASSDELQALDYGVLQRSVAAGRLDYTYSELIRRYEKSHVAMDTVRTTSEGNFLVCSHQFFRGSESALLVAKCAEEASFDSFQATFAAVARTVQWLR